MASIEKAITGKGSPRWIVRWDVTENGKRVQKKKRFKSSADAKAFRSDIENRLNTGTYSDAKGMTLG